MNTLFETGAKTPIISMWRPWANWVALGWKTIESRKHQRFAGLAGQRIGIHASATWDKNALDIAWKFLQPEWIEETAMWEHNANGMLICTVLVTEHRRLTEADEHRALIECQTERYGLILEEAKPILPPVLMKGQQGIWREWIEPKEHV